jgi:hypothetical protein
LHDAGRCATGQPDKRGNHHALLRDGRPPIADLSDNATVVALVKAAYAPSPLPLVT